MYNLLLRINLFGIVSDNMERIEYGAVFHHNTNLDISNKYWLHSHEIMFDFEEINLKFDECNSRRLAQREGFCTFAGPITDYAKSVYNSVMREVKGNIHNILRIISNRAQRSNSRNTRSLLPFVGSVHRFLYNIANLSDISKVVEKMNDVQRLQIDHMDATFQYWTNQMSSWARQYDHRMFALYGSMNMTAHSLMQLYDRHPLPI